MPKISELDTGTVTSAGKIAVAEGSTTIQATVADIGAVVGGAGIQAKLRFPKTTINNWTSPQAFDSSFNVSKVTGISGYYTVHFINAVVDPVITGCCSEGSLTVVIKDIASDGLSFDFEIHNTPGNPALITAHSAPVYIIVA